MQPVMPALESALATCENIVSLLRFNHLERLKYVAKDQFDISLLDSLGLRQYNYLYHNLTFGTLYAQDNGELLIYRTYVNIRVYKFSEGKITQILYHEAQHKLVTIAKEINLAQLYTELSLFLETTYITDEVGCTLPLVRYLELLPLEVSISQAAFNRFQALSEDNFPFIDICRDSVTLITILPAIYKRISPGTPLSVGPVVASQQALRIARTISEELLTLNDERSVATSCKLTLLKNKSFKSIADVHVKMWGSDEPTNNLTDYNKVPDTLDMLRLFLDFREKLTLQIEIHYRV